MLPETQVYERGTIITHEDLNVFGQGIKLLNNISGALGFADNTGLAFRNAPNKLETIWAQLGTAHTSGTATLGYEWAQVVPNTNGAFVTLTGGMTSGTGTANLAVPSNPTGSTSGVVLLRRGFDPATGDRTWGFQNPSGGGSALTPAVVLSVYDVGVYTAKLIVLPYTNTVSLASPQQLTFAINLISYTASGEVFLGNWNEFNHGTNTATGEVLRVGAIYMAQFFATTDHTARASLYMTQGADGIFCE